MTVSVEVRGTAVMMSQAEEGLKLFKALEGSPAEYDLPAAEKYKAEVEAKIAILEDEAALLTGKEKKKERSEHGKVIASLKAEQTYVDACKLVKGLEAPFSHFVVKEAVTAVIEPAAVVAPAADKAKKKDAKTQENAGLSLVETKELENLKQQIIERKALLKEQGLSGGQQNKDEDVVKMVNRMTELKEKQEPGSTKKEKDSKKDAKKKTPLSQDEQTEYDKLSNEVEIYKHKLKTEFGYGCKDIKADPDLQDMEVRLAAFAKRSA